jgi:hypothetical protein
MTPQRRDWEWYAAVGLGQIALIVAALVSWNVRTVEHRIGPGNARVCHSTHLHCRGWPVSWVVQRQEYDGLEQSGPVEDLGVAPLPLVLMLAIALTLPPVFVGAISGESCPPPSRRGRLMGCVLFWSVGLLSMLWFLRPRDTFLP